MHLLTWCLVSLLAVGSPMGCADNLAFILLTSSSRHVLPHTTAAPCVDHISVCLRMLLCVHRLDDAGTRLELLHSTPVEGIPGALTPFKGRLMAGVGPVLRLYDLGRKKLLRKCEYRSLPHHIAQLSVLGSRIFVADVQESMHFFRYNRTDNKLYCFADDIVPRYVTSLTQLDYDTVAGGDKFGNFFVLRLPADVSAQARQWRLRRSIAGLGCLLLGKQLHLCCLPLHDAGAATRLLVCARMHPPPPQYVR